MNPCTPPHRTRRGELESVRLLARLTKQTSSMSEQSWNVKCHVCGFKLGTNKQHCGQAGTGGRKVKYPPCVWAHSDDSIVRKAFAVEAEAKQKEESEETELEATRKRYAAGQISFEEVREQEEENVVGAGDNDLQPADDNAEGEIEERTSCYVPGPRAPSPTTARPSEPPAKKRAGAKGSHTKWTSVTRTMLYKCIQQKDPFHAQDKGQTWQTIADAMREATQHMQATADGDLRVNSNGKTIGVFYKRMKDQHTENEDIDKHSGGTGETRAETDDDKRKKDERVQLAACIELERAAETAVTDRRTSIKCHDTMKNGIVNDAVIECAVKDEKVRSKAVKELASRLRQAKMRKMAYESQHKDGTYTYTAQDMESFKHWDTLKTHFQDMPDADEVDEGPAQKSSTQLTKALESIQAQGAIARSSFTPVAPNVFAEAFFAAKRAHVAAHVLSLKHKLEMVDKDVQEGTITAQEAEIYKKKIKEAHYSFASP
jgi:hypothetical protein